MFVTTFFTGSARVCTELWSATKREKNTKARVNPEWTSFLQFHSLACGERDAVLAHTLMPQLSSPAESGQKGTVQASLQSPASGRSFSEMVDRL